MDPRSANIVVVSVVMGMLATVSTVLRFWSRKIGHTSIGADDIVCVVGLVLTLGICALSIAGAVAAGVGAHAVLETEGPNAGFPVTSFLVTYGRIFYAMQILHTCAMPVLKASLLLFYRRLFKVSKAFRIATKVVAAFVGAWFIAIFFTTIFQCYPVHFNWATTVEGFEHCIANPHAFWATAALTNVASDIAIVAIPFPLILKLNMSSYHKIAILAYVLTGALVTVAGIGRAVSYFTTDMHSIDWSYETYDWFIWTPIEPTFGTIGICLPIMKPLFTRFMPAGLTNAVKSYMGRSQRSETVKGTHVNSKPTRLNSDDQIALKFVRQDT